MNPRREYAPTHLLRTLLDCVDAAAEGHDISIALQGLALDVRDHFRMPIAGPLPVGLFFCSTPRETPETNPAIAVMETQR